MKMVLCTAVIAAFTSSPAIARPEWFNPLQQMDHVTCGFFDPNYIRTPCEPPGNQDTNKDKWRQHLGTDFRAGVNDTVYAPVSGTINCSEDGRTKTADQAVAIIRDGVTKEEHILGHVSCTVASGPVTRGQPVAKVLYEATGTHFHWGFNVKSVSSARAYTSRCLRKGIVQQCAWGWGEAPYEATRSEAVNLGWRPVL
ncbi:MAG: Peptidase family [Sphingomonadales bacterium]|jgi:murein DD-endopeptidase MepM/ murein hydrolase activator NlpD|nr:Peptidase family [Sphingomonadales bacterium]